MLQGFKVCKTLFFIPTSPKMLKFFSNAPATTTTTADATIVKGFASKDVTVCNMIN